MKNMMNYDLMESFRNTNEWLGATAKAIGDYPALAMVPNPMIPWMRAWGEVTERTFQRMVTKPDWDIESITGEDGRDHVVQVEHIIRRPFGDLIHFAVSGRRPRKRRVLLVAPMSGHYATLLRKTVISLLPDCEVYITDWHNARDIPVSKGKFDVEDYTLYLVDFMKELGSDLHVLAVCQPAPLTLAATAYLAEIDPKAQPRTLTLFGGPIDPDANVTQVTEFGNRMTMGQIEKMMIQQVGFKYPGVGRKVYPGLLQLASFMSMNADMHSEAFREQILRVAQGKASEHDSHNVFYDEYLAVMDMTAEFYLSTVERVFKGRDIARNAFTVNGHKVDIGKITTVAVKTVEGENDDISAPGQCRAALDLLTGLPDSKKAWHLEPGAGHYGIFAGRSWRRNIRPLVLDFIDSNADAPKDNPTVKPAAAKTTTPRKRPAAKTAATRTRKTTTATKPAPAAPKAKEKPAAAAAPTAQAASPAKPVVEQTAPVRKPATTTRRRAAVAKTTPKKDG